MNIYDGCGIISSEFLPEVKTGFIDMMLSASCIVMEIQGIAMCMKNKYGHRNLEDCKEYNFMHIKGSDISGTSYEISSKYYDKNIWITFD